MTDEQFGEASDLLLRCEAVIDAGTPIGTLNQRNLKLLRLAEDHNIPVYRSEKMQEEQVWNT